MTRKFRPVIALQTRAGNTDPRTARHAITEIFPIAFWIGLISILFQTYPSHKIAAQSPVSARNSRPPEEIMRLASMHIESGEYPCVEELLGELSQAQGDEVRKLMFAHQLQSGAIQGAGLTALGIRDDQRRREVMSLIRQSYSNSEPVTELASPHQSAADATKNNPGQSGGLGGITDNDFQPLIQLITNTISQGKWTDDGGVNSIRSYASGVYVDHTGTLQRIKIDPAKSRKIEQPIATSDQWQNWFDDDGNRNPHWSSPLRKVSLNRLERMAELSCAMGLPLDETIQNLAGLTSISHVFIDPTKRELVIAGPAGPWHRDSTGRAVNSETGQPVMQLEDFVIALRNAFDADGKFGCTIDPRPESLTAVQEFLRNTKLKGNAWKRELRNTVGKQDIIVFGIDPRTHAARVLVEADHHMKLIGMGLEPSIPEVPSYLDRLSFAPGQSKPPTDVVRWWFTTSDSDIRCDERFEFFEFTGTGLQVLSESELLDQQGRRIHTGSSTAPTQGFARDFTKHFQRVAERYPVYRQLQNIFSLALVANLIKDQRLEFRSQRRLAFFRGEHFGSCTHYPVQLAPHPTQVESVMNERVFAKRNGSATGNNSIIGVSGGVEFDAAVSLKPERLKSVNHVDSSSVRNSAALEKLDEPAWWWD